MANEWRQCVDWLVQCQMLSKDHNLNSDKARVNDLASLLKDGVLICNLLNHLVPETIDPKDFSQRPQKSQFLCQKNVNVFLQRCRSVFHIDEKDLFAVADLTHLQNYGKVLHTLSVLSQTHEAQKSRVPSFSLNKSPSFSKLEPSQFADDDADSGYGSTCGPDNSLYDDLCSLKRTLKRRKPTPAAQESATKTRRDFCIEEIVETERNYVEALEMINTKFMMPLRNCKHLSPKDHEKIFMGNEKLLSVHREFHEQLRKASCRDGQTTLTIPDCFVMFKEKFLFYGEFCSNLTESQELLSKLCHFSPALLQKIIECQRDANEGKFKLHDLLAIPMQRVLKYHLLINELFRNTEESHPERKSLERALEEMQDLSLFVNEVRRDHEILNAISLLEKSITDLPVNIELKDCGRILIDGEMKVKLATESATHSRHLFLFDKRLLVCKPTKGDTYSYKTSLLLSSYKIDDTKDKMLIQLSEISGNVYQITAKNPEARKRWRDAIILAQENVIPPHAQNKKHDFQITTFKRPTICDVCRKFLRGFIFQGYFCQKTKMAAHKECLEKAADMDGPPTPLPPRSKDKVIAVKSYAGFPGPTVPSQVTLKFSVGDSIEVISSSCSSDPTWMEGELNGKRGVFPRSHVQTKARKRSESDDAAPSCLQNHQTVNGHYVNVGASDINISSKPWYAGDMTREAANDVLENLPQGAFVVRRSADGKGDHAVSIQYNGPKHIKIGQTEKCYFLTAALSFPSITALIDYHSQNSLEKFFPELKTRLSLPYADALKSSVVNNKDIVGYCVAKYNYSATAPNHLTIRRGDRIAILSKAGDERGWWKGFFNGKTGFFPKSYVSE